MYAGRMRAEQWAMRDSGARGHKRSSSVNGCIRTATLSVLQKIFDWLPGTADVTERVAVSQCPAHLRGAAEMVVQTGRQWQKKKSQKEGLNGI